MKAFAVLVAACLVALAWSLPAWAEVKIAVVDMEEAVNQSEDGKKAQAELKRRGQEFEKELRDLREEIQTLRAELEKSAMLLKPEAKLSKQRELERKMRHYQDRQRDARQEWGQAQRDAFAPILAKMKEVVGQIGQKRGYTLVLEAGATLYNPDSVDITQQVIKAYNQAN
jgi:outer membrane protein